MHHGTPLLSAAVHSEYVVPLYVNGNAQGVPSLTVPPVVAQTPALATVALPSVCVPGGQKKPGLHGAQAGRPTP